jgi:aspartate racemase
MEPVLGIIGGMGPLASAEFIKTIYECNLRGPEQQAPRCVMFSDPSVPDRTEAILTGSDSAVMEFLQRAYAGMQSAGAHRVIVPCMTMHHFLQKLDAALRGRTISLLDLLADAMSGSRSRLLMLATNGARHSNVLVQHARWREIEGRVVLPGGADQAEIHELIYSRVKANLAGPDILKRFIRMSQRYGTDGCIAGCTDLHLLTKAWLRTPALNGSFEICDPLLMFAQQYRRYMHDRS